MRGNFNMDSALLTGFHELDWDLALLMMERGTRGSVTVDPTAEDEIVWSLN